MTFPTIPTAGANTLLTSNQSTATTTHTFPSLTTLDNAAGDLLLAIIVTYQGSTTNAEFSGWGAGFNEHIDQSANSTTVQSIGMAYKFSDGTETGTFTVTSATSNRSVMFLLSIKGAHASTLPQNTAKVNGTTAAADPGAFNPTTWGVEDTLWIAVAVNGETSLAGSFTGITAAPTNYTGYVDSGIIGGDVIGALEGAVAFRQNAVDIEDVGTWTLDVGAAGNSALLIAVRPAASALLMVYGARNVHRIEEQRNRLVGPFSSATFISPPAAAGGTVNQTDQTALTDTRLLEVGLARTDQAGLTDQALLALSQVYTDQAGLTDTATVSLVKSVEPVDQTGLTDARLLSVELGRTDQVGLTDVRLLQVEQVRTDQTGLTDSASQSLVKAVTATDDTGLTDSGLSIDFGEVPAADQVGLTDTRLLDVGLVRTDGAGLTDTRVIESGKVFTTTDQVGLVDSQAYSQTHVHTDQAGLTDTAGLTESLVRTDQTGLTDAASIGLLQAVERTDVVGLTDSLVVSRTAVLDDLAGLSDAVTVAVSRPLVVTDQTGLTDTANATTIIPIPPFVDRPFGGYVDRPPFALVQR